MVENIIGSFLDEQFYQTNRSLITYGGIKDTITFSFPVLGPYIIGIGMNVQGHY